MTYLKRKLTAIIISLIMIVALSESTVFADTNTLTTAPVLEVPVFTDISKHPGKELIERWSNYGIIKGYNGLFRPNDIVSKNELETVIDRLLGNQNFTDGIVIGNDVTREEAAVVICKAFTVEATSKDLTEFLDINQVDESNRNYIIAMEDNNYINGYNHYFKPKDTLTRIQMLIILDNIIGEIDTIFSHSYVTKLQGGFPDTIEKDAKILGWTVSDFQRVCEKYT